MKELVNDLKSGIAFSEDFKDVAFDNLMQLVSRLESKCKNLNEQLESLTKDTRYAIMQAGDLLIESHFQVEGNRLQIIAEQLGNRLTLLS